MKEKPLLKLVRVPAVLSWTEPVWRDVLMGAGVTWRKDGYSITPAWTLRMVDHAISYRAHPGILMIALCLVHHAPPWNRIRRFAHYATAMEAGAFSFSILVGENWHEAVDANPGLAHRLRASYGRLSQNALGISFGDNNCITITTDRQGDKEHERRKH